MILSKALVLSFHSPILSYIQEYVVTYSSLALNTVYFDYVNLVILWSLDWTALQKYSVLFCV